ncbi:MAG: hypothetical protein R3C19_04945 [Planctomycetaceae bacterium]
MPASRTRVSQILIAAAIAVFTVLSQPAALAQVDRFQPVDQGLLGTQTGLIWGHHFKEVNAVYSRATPLYTWDWAMATTVIIEEDWDPEGDEEWLYLTYQEFSDTLYGPVDVEGGVWRLPTRDELQDAIGAGMMLQLDMSPADGLQLFDPVTFHDAVWSSTKGKKKRGGFDSAYRVSLIDGSSDNITVGSALWGAIPVFDPTGGGDDNSGPGNGNGNGNGKNK